MTKDSGQTRDKLIESGMKNFYAHGFENTSLQKVAEDAGLTRGAAYWHFEDKADLFKETILYALARVRKRKLLLFANENQLDFMDQVIELIDIPKADHVYYHYIQNATVTFENDPQFLDLYNQVKQAKVDIYQFLLSGLIEAFPNVAEGQLNATAILFYSYYETYFTVEHPAVVIEENNRQNVKLNVELVFNALKQY